MGHSSDVHKLILRDDGILLEPIAAAAADPAQTKKIGKSLITDRGSAKPRVYEKLHYEWNISYESVIS